MPIYECKTSDNSRVFSTTNKNGFKLSKLGSKRKEIIKQQLDRQHVDKVYMRGGVLYRFMLNGCEERIYE